MSLNSTTVRFMIGVGLRVAPAQTYALATRLFFTPRRSRRARERSVPVLPDGSAGMRGTIRSDGEDVVFWSWGQGPTVLLVHGWEGRAAQLVPFVPPLVRVGFRALAVDLPGHGLSPGRQLNLVRMGRVLQDLVKALGPVEAVIAHSFGGAGAVLAQLEAPFAKRLVAIAPSAEPRTWVDQAAAQMGIPPERRGRLYRHIEAEVGRRFEELDLRHHAGRMEAPLLVLHDPDDLEVPFAQGEAVAKVSRNGELEAIPGAGHRRILKDPGAISRAVEFATGVARPLEWSPDAKPAGSGLRWENRSGTA